MQEQCQSMSTCFLFVFLKKQLLPSVIAVVITNMAVRNAFSTNTLLLSRSLSFCHSSCLWEQRQHTCLLVWGFTVLPSFIYLLYFLLLFLLFFVLLYLLTLSRPVPTPACLPAYLPACLPARGYRRLPKSRKRRCVINGTKRKTLWPLYFHSHLLFFDFIFACLCILFHLCLKHLNVHALSSANLCQVYLCPSVCGKRNLYLQKYCRTL